ncbi:helix-turn-helix transcriptional regulator [Kutzneria viridogrisea]|uniref:Transcriptional regulator with XRE-family HTH domain n=1 Tax=Kutzneria viridogrisea TaxID=47990 RepID=A0ABR6B994_9PSEU|nr:transcriptional regulator with XRE-family HTH domain [Kutzneria viridogrisea]
MGPENEVRSFLTSRRARITPKNAGLPVYGGNRRVAGLRREEVALLAGVSTDYYNRLERGNLRGVSVNVLDSVARALQLDEAEHAYLRDLARAANATSAVRRSASPQVVRPAHQLLLGAMPGAAAAILNRRMDLLATNQLGRALFADIFSSSEQPANLARFAFLDPRGRGFYTDWEKTADDAVAVLRSAVGSNPDDHQLSSLIGELLARSDDFATRWAAHNVRFHCTGTKRLHHPVVGDLALTFVSMDLGVNPGLTMLAYIAKVGSTSEDALRMLASWAATQEPRTDLHLSPSPNEH